MVIKPLILQGHDRPLTRVRVNRDGDLLFTSGKNSSPCVWYVENGERVGTYEGHQGVVSDLDVSWDSRRLVTAGGGDEHVRLWDVECGVQVSSHHADTNVQSVYWSYSANYIAYTTMQRGTSAMSKQSYAGIIDVRVGEQMTGDGDYKSPLTPCARKFVLEKTSKAIVFSHLDDMITVGLNNGGLYLFDLRADTTEPRNFINDKHKGEIRDIQLSADRLCLITASQDKTAQLFDARSLEPLNKMYKSPRPVNSASVSPTRDHVCIGGGEDAMTVTQTTTSGAHFDAKFFHLVFCDEFANVKGHFGPINSLCYTPDGDTFITGGEDGFIRIQRFDDEFKQFDMDY